MRRFSLLIVSMLVACTRGAEINLAGHSIGEVVTNMVRRAETGDTNYFRPVLDSYNAGHASKLLGMIQRSGMLTNYSSRIEQSENKARLNYHYLERGCHFQVDLHKDGSAWKVKRIWLCR